ncbi:GNAT family N-acetyltransferase [uncultured Rubinisphaera sp.]|uniref:GNAT family N-acetyltransferase n=1 Tax=uncultured Rubinisphaera sp. TaxID=1678686 RepID=UPI0030DBCC0D
MAEIRALKFEELQLLVDWAGKEGWNPGLNDVDSFWNLDPEGFLALCENDKFIGGGAIIRHSDDYGFMGLFIVDEPFRGRKLGTKLWLARRDQLLSRLKPGGTIGLDGVDAMVKFYEKGGFQQYTRHRRFQLNEPSPECKRSETVCDLKTVNFETVLEFDRRCFPASRPQPLSNWIHQPGAISLAVVENETLKGFGVMRPCRVGWKIGPLFADSLHTADQLFQAFQLQQAGQQIFLDIPDNNPQAIELCRKYQMEEVFGCERMYLGSPPKLDNESIFGITNLETG